jgi:hypothetical protein
MVSITYWTVLAGSALGFCAATFLLIIIFNKRITAVDARLYGPLEGWEITVLIETYLDGRIRIFAPDDPAQRQAQYHGVFSSRNIAFGSPSWSWVRDDAGSGDRRIVALGKVYTIPKLKD